MHWTRHAKSPHCLINFTDTDLFPTSSHSLFCIWNWNQNKTEKEKQGPALTTHKDLSFYFLPLTKLFSSFFPSDYLSQQKERKLIPVLTNLSLLSSVSANDDVRVYSFIHVSIIGFEKGWLSQRNYIIIIIAAFNVKSFSFFLFSIFLDVIFCYWFALTLGQPLCLVRLIDYQYQNAAM